MRITEEMARICAKCGYIPFSDEHSDDDYYLYIQAMDVLTTKSPVRIKRMNRNALEMVRSKVRRIKDHELRSHAFGEYRKLSERIAEFQQAAR